MAARNRFRVGALSASAVSPALARLIAELSGARELARRTDSLIVTDPAAGAGDLLAAVAHVLGPDCTPMFTGAEADPVLARLVRRRLTVTTSLSPTWTSASGRNSGRVGGPQHRRHADSLPAR